MSEGSRSAPPDTAPGLAVRRTRRSVHLALLLATLYTMTLAGALQVGAAGLEGAPGSSLMLDPAFLLLGLPYSLCLVAILGTHELGHYLACRWYRVDASLPFFLPSLPVPIGTFGAFIRIRSPLPDRIVLFDVGVAGPIAGFIVAIPVLLYGAATARAIPVPEGAQTLGDPLLVRWLIDWLGPALPAGHDVLWCGPLAAGWVGCLATALNLFPVGQLDGGHICYALSERFHRTASSVTLCGFVAAGLLAYPGWLVLATLLFMMTPRHPRLLDETVPLTAGRRMVALLALLILGLCFIPRPFPSPDL